MSARALARAFLELSRIWAFHCLGKKVFELANMQLNGWIQRLTFIYRKAKTRHRSIISWWVCQERLLRHSENPDYLQAGDSDA
jgi:hypothetical protein